MRGEFPLFQSHLDLAKSFWKELVHPGDVVIDATCGNGHDTLFLSQLQVKLYAMDIQQEAIDEAKARVQNPVIFVMGCHSQFPEEISLESVKLVVYNLGYLPGGDKGFTTKVKTTLISVKQALSLLTKGGVISITCYPGHPAGEEEEKELLAFTNTLNPKEWSVTYIRFHNRKLAPSLLMIQKKG